MKMLNDGLECLIYTYTYCGSPRTHRETTLAVDILATSLLTRQTDTIYENIYAVYKSCWYRHSCNCKCYQTQRGICCFVRSKTETWYSYLMAVKSLGNEEVSGYRGLDTLRITPVSRIPRYKLLLKVKLPHQQPLIIHRTFSNVLLKNIRTTQMLRTRMKPYRS